MKRILIFIALCTITFLPLRAMACMPSPDYVFKDAKSAKAIIIAEISARHDHTVSTHNANTIEYDLKIHGIYKDAYNENHLKAYSSKTSCGFFHDVGTIFIAYLDTPIPEDKPLNLNALTSIEIKNSVQEAKETLETIEQN